MSILQTLKPFWPLLITFVLPRAFGYYQALKTAVRTRPPPRPLPNRASTCLNLLFGSICFFLFSSIPRGTRRERDNIFASTGTRLHVPIDVLFSRLALLRPRGVLSSADEMLRSKLTNRDLRLLYLRYGPDTTTNCSFCEPDDLLSYTLYHLPSNILLPHIAHLVVLGLATSSTVSGTIPARFRTRAILAALIATSIDIYVTSSSVQQINPNMPSPPSIYARSLVLRPLAICLFDTVLAFLIWASCTGRFVFFPFLASAADGMDADPELQQQRTQQMVTQTNLALQMAQMKMRAFNVARNAVVRDEALKRADDRYWRDVVAIEGPTGMATEAGEDVWDDEDVQRAMARAFGQGTVDVARMRREADAFVMNVTRGLDDGNNT